MKKYLFIILCSLFLVACNDEIAFIGDTPEEAVKKLELDFVKDMKEIQLADINSEQKISVFRANAFNESEREYYVAFIEKKGKQWVAKEAFGVGNPIANPSFSSGGNLLEAGFTNTISVSSAPQFTDGQYFFKLPNNEASLWVEILD